MSFKEVKDLDCETSISLGGLNRKTGKANPTTVEGYFLGSKVTQSQKSRTGTALLHIFDTAEGRIGVWGKTDLDRKLTTVKSGTMTRVTQNGTVRTPNGDMYKFKVEIDETNTLDGSPLQNTSSNEAEALNVDDEEMTDEVVPSQPQKPSRPATVPSADAQARVRSLLAGTRK
jgi:hypothetical protein